MHCAHKWVDDVTRVTSTYLLLCNLSSLLFMALSFLRNGLGLVNSNSDKISNLWNWYVWDCDAEIFI